MLRVAAQDDEQVGVAAAIEGSLIEDRLAGKIAVLYDKDDGYFDNINQTIPPNPVSRKKKVSTTSATRAATMPYPPGLWSA